MNFYSQSLPGPNNSQPSMHSTAPASANPAICGAPASAKRMNAMNSNEAMRKV